MPRRTESWGESGVGSQGSLHNTVEVLSFMGRSSSRCHYYQVPKESPKTHKPAKVGSRAEGGVPVARGLLMAQKAGTKQTLSGGVTS